MAQYNNNVLGQSGTNFFFGVVADNVDPLKAARVRVRCHGLHSMDESLLPTDLLPWASVMIPVTENDKSMSDLRVGATVFGIFIDGDEMQVPFVMGIVPGIDVATNATTVSPEATLRESPQKALKASNRVSGIVGIAGTFEEPVDPSDVSYPHNHARLTDGGHVVELDDTEGAERIHVFHKSGSYVEMHPDGKVVVRSVGDKYQITTGNEYCYVSGDLNLVCDGGVNIVASGNVNVRGDIIVEGDVIASGISLVNHVHGGVDSGPSTTSTPI